VPVICEPSPSLAVLQSTGWNRKQAAAILEIDYEALLNKMKKRAQPAGN